MEFTRDALEDRPPQRGAYKLFLISGALALLAIGLGGWICAASGVPATLWIRNLAAWLVGALLAWGLSRCSGAWLFPTVLIVTALLLAATLFSPGQLNVHRWVSLGPLSINIAMLTLPAGLVALVAVARHRFSPWLLALGCLGVLVAQPDASQATAFGGALVCIALKGAGGARVRRAAVAGVVLLAATSWLRPDPLKPVPEVEEILRLAYAASPALAGLAFASLILFSVAPGVIARGRDSDEQLAGVALSSYFLISAAMPFVGAFPVPLVGIGVSPVLGAWLGVGLLTAFSHARAQSRSGPSPELRA